MEIWYAIPSANVERATAVFGAWRGMGYRTAVLIDKGRPAPKNADLVFEADPWPGYYRSVNRMCRELADRADIVVTGGDDITPDFKKKAERIGAECYERYPDGYFVMQPTGDELPGTDQICGSPWIGRGWIKRAYRGQGAFCPDYFIFFGDEELKNVAQLRGVLWQRPDLLQYHDHWTRSDGPKKTDYQVRNDRNWNNDEAVFKSRKAAGFPGHEPVAT